MDVAAFRVADALHSFPDRASRLSDIRAQRVVRVLVLRQHRQHIVEAGNPLEVGDAQVNRRGLLAHEHPHPVGHGWLVVATRRGAGAPKRRIYPPPGLSRRPKEKSLTHNSCYEVVMLAVITCSGLCYVCYVRCYEVL